MPIEFKAPLPQPRCEECKGRGTVWDQNGGFKCQRCDGNGWGYLYKGKFLAPDRDGNCPKLPKEDGGE